MKPDLLVVTAVHPSDDPRIREKLIGSLSDDFVVRYASPPPGPTDSEGLTWIPLEGSRWRRNLRALRLCLRRPGDVVSFHDPELLPVAILTRLIRRRPVVFDVHENVPEQIQTKPWIPAPLRPLIAAVSRVGLRVAERIIAVSLAEWGYAGLFRRSHPVFPNYPDATSLPLPAATRDEGSVVYVGDVTEHRGALTAARAAIAVPGVRSLVMIGRCRPDLADEIRRTVAGGDVDVEIAGWLPHRRAMERVARCRVGLIPLHDIPNYRNSLPTKLLEYLALGVPVVASDLPGTREVAHGLDAVRLVAPGSVDDLAAALASALADDASLRGAVRQAPEIRRRYVWPAADVRAFYGALAAR